ncbi:sodium ABC transporter ATP-binding protein [Paenibacillus pectinilyticus]|uniref:Sodium ABC transporter ATP-binding protein n=1 Tax=Paenibacillus pectinilyticus TaxID=512399 RepID=A0A1C0ZT17_9BACL|nr:ABC transporter ATP-binding protein [Paenibacillus pectinilyticus]OCT11222.1 sodium ABC transporter ATP-binding protein [Paenibacillus pectinilyticus]
MTYPLVIEDVSKQYGDKTAVNRIHLRVKQGEIYGLLGANGAGKTTTMRMVLGLIYPDQGSIQWNGQGYREELRSLMGYLPEERGLYPKVKISEQIIYLAELRGVKKNQADRSLKEWLERFEVPDYYNRRVEELSKGNQQKIQFIAAVIHNPEILILDEAFSGLDPVNVELLKKTVKSLRDEGKTILFSSHRMDHVEELCEHICILHRSNTILQGSLKEIKASFPKERVILETEEDIEGLDRLSGVTSVNKGLKGYEIRITSPETAQQILQLAMEQSVVQRFQIMEPTLNEIFIQKVGNNHE